MRVPLAWLKEFVKVSLSPAQLAERLTMVGVEVERIIDRRKDFSNVVVGQVVELKPHPNADKLRLAYVVVKPDGQPQEIVCGAPNIAVGQKVAVALLGAKLPNGLTIEARQIRGVASNGMVCAEDELGLGSSHAGTMVLDTSLPVGMSFAEAIGYDDVVFELAIPANRSDLHSIRGVAWEIADAVGGTFQARPVNLKEGQKPTSGSIRVSIAAPKLVSKYTARVIRGVTDQPSPTRIQRLLRAAGMRPVNAVVDATNYIMLAYGQPLHAFDAAKVRSPITVRLAKAGEHLKTLDGINRKLDSSMLVVADAVGPIALAGVMGGADSEITGQTKDIILESAIFDPVSVRRTARKLGLISEASKRFEKGLPVGLQAEASNAAAALISDWAGGTVERGLVSAGTVKPRSFLLKISPAAFEAVLGMEVPPSTAKRILTKLGFKLKGTSKLWSVTVPWWRLDVTTTADLVDEVGRVLGYQNLPEALPDLNVVPASVPELLRLKDELRDVLSGLGFSETISHAFYGEPWAKEVGGQHYEILNPLDAAQHYLRKSVMPQLQSILWYEVDAGKDAKVFQIGRVFLPGQEKIEGQQPWKLAIGLALKPDKGYVPTRNLKGTIEELFTAINLPFSKIQVEVFSGNLKGRIVEWCELDIAKIRDARVKKSFKPLPKFPSATRDIAIWVKVGLIYSDLESAVRKVGGAILESVNLFDVFDRDNRRSLAFRLTFRAPDRTLTEAEISAKMKAITDALKALGAEIR